MSSNNHVQYNPGITAPFKTVIFWPYLRTVRIPVTKTLMYYNVYVTCNFDHCIRPMHLGAFRQAVLAPKVSSGIVSSYVPRSSNDVITSSKRLRWSGVFSLKPESRKLRIVPRFALYKEMCTRVGLNNVFLLTYRLYACVCVCVCLCIYIYIYI